MTEVAFLKQNSDRWRQFETLIAQPQKANPDLLAELFIQLTDDLAYAVTNFPNSKTAGYLNGLTAKVHQAIYKNKKEESGRLKAFWKYELPLLFKDHHPQLLYALIIFVAAIAIGAVSAAHDDTFVRLILGDGYVNKTLDNIEQGDPLAIYKSSPEATMFLAITINNIRVAFMAFAFGIIFSAGTAYILFNNGVMVGAFFFIFFEKGLLWKSILVVMIHGTFELLAIVIAGGAGFVVGNSILFPGTYTRQESFMRGAKRGLKITVGLIPIFITAGFLESYITRHTDMPPGLSLLIIFGSLAVMIFYFVLYPYQLQRVANQRISGFMG